MLEYRRAQGYDFDRIVELQNKNLLSQLKAEERGDGFLSTAFTRRQFEQMNESLCVVVAVEENQVLGYACASQAEFHTSPLWRAMIAACSQMKYRGKPVLSYEFFLGSPICIDKQNRGRGIFQGLCQKILDIIPPKYDISLAFISEENKRNMIATQRVGFEMIGQFEFESKVYCVMLLWL